MNDFSKHKAPDADGLLMNSIKRFTKHSIINYDTVMLNKLFQKREARECFLTHLIRPALS
jgi:hypothetical protein